MTGAGGFLGRHLCRRLADAGAEVHGVSRRPPASDGAPIRWWQADVASAADVNRVCEATSPHVVYHLAGCVDAAPRLDLLLPTYHSLLTSAVNLLAAATARGGRLVLVGSLEEQRAADGGAPPASPYGAAKTAASMYAATCHALFGTPVVVLRTFMVFGPGQPAWKLIPSTLRALFDGVAPELSSGRRQLDWIYVDDAMAAFVAAGSAEGIEGRVLDVGSGRLVSIRDLVGRLVALVGANVEPCFGALADRPERPARAADIAATKQALGWEPEIPLEEGLARTVAWYRERLPARPGRARH
ncbi:MAG: NAD-dependent epimerase/dehydratase family protein [Armatimonadota bacterium]|nr:NAD-dependent epimerase/dehydratase family protein [Armatimonadota bacterium]